MTFGSSNWAGSPWTLDEAESLKVIKAAYDNGINTWDTADTYSNGKSEIIVGKALKELNIPRQKVVILSKIYNPVMDDDSRPVGINDGPLVNQMGLSRKHVFYAVDKCLERLGTDYIGKQDQCLITCMEFLNSVGRRCFADPSPGPRELANRDYACSPRSSPVRKSPLHWRLIDVCLGVRPAAVYRQVQWLDRVHFHAAILQFAVPRGGA